MIKCKLRCKSGHVSGEEAMLKHTIRLRKHETFCLNLSPFARSLLPERYTGIYKVINFILSLLENDDMEISKPFYPQMFNQI